MEKIYKIEAIIRPQRLEAVQEALYEMDLHGITVSEVRGAGRTKGISHTFRGSQYANNLSSRLKVEIVLAESSLDEAVDAIVQAAQTGEVGDGKLFVIPVSEVVRIRTGEKGEIALS